MEFRPLLTRRVSRNARETAGGILAAAKLESLTPRELEEKFMSNDQNLWMVLGELA
jgi:hypothetical protein